MKYYYERGELEKRWIDNYCKGDWRSCMRYDMEEKGQPHPDCMFPSGEICEKLEHTGGI